MGFYGYHVCVFLAGTYANVLSRSLLRLHDDYILQQWANFSVLPPVKRFS